MSKSNLVKIKCPSCNRESFVNTWESINVKDAPNVRYRIFNMEEFMFSCPHCNYAIPIAYDMTYTNPDENYMIRLMFEEMADEENDTRFALDEGGRLEKYYKNLVNFRLVSSHEELAEKIIIFDNHLDDRIIEISKVLFVQNHPDLFPTPPGLLVLGMKSEDEKLELIEEDENGTYCVPTELAEELAEEEDEYYFTCYYPDRSFFTVDFPVETYRANCDLYLEACNKIKDRPLVVDNDWANDFLLGAFD